MVRAAGRIANCFSLSWRLHAIIPEIPGRLASTALPAPVKRRAAHVQQTGHVSPGFVLSINWRVCAVYWPVIPR